MLPQYSRLQSGAALVGFRFGVTFFTELRGVPIPNPLDIRFQRVSGLSCTVETRTVNEGGQSLYCQRLPQQVKYDNLTLERGMVLGSPLSLDLTLTLSEFEFRPSHVLVSLLSEQGLPLSAWLLRNAFFVRWSLAELNATEERILIDTIELAYTTLLPIKV